MAEAVADERKRILQMVSEGKLSAEEGVKLLEAMGESERVVAGAQGAASGARFIRIRVFNGQSGKAKVSANLPIALADVALRLIPKDAGINPAEVLAALKSAGGGKILEVDDEDSGHHIEIVVE